MSDSVVQAANDALTIEFKTCQNRFCERLLQDNNLMFMLLVNFLTPQFAHMAFHNKILELRF